MANVHGDPLAIPPAILLAGLIAIVVQNFQK